MKTATKNIKTAYDFERSTYNPALDHLMGKVFFKEKMEQGRAILKKYGLPEELIKELNTEANLGK